MTTGVDARLGGSSRLPARVSVTTPAGLSQIVEITRESTTPGGGSLVASSITETVELQDDANRRTVTTYIAAAGGAPATMTSRSPDGRATQYVLGTAGRIDRIRFGTWASGAFAPSAMHDLQLGYDVRGRLESTTQGSGLATRNSTIEYDTDGFVEALVDAAGDEFAIEADEDGRPTSLTTSGGHAIGLAYDDDGNLSSVTPAGRPVHRFSRDGAGAVTRYAPPDVLPGDDFTEYVYDSTHALREEHRPDGGEIVWMYDAAGRVDGVAAPGADRAFEYWPTGQLRSASESHGGTTELGWDGPLLVRSTRSTTFAGEVTWAYAADHSVVSETVLGTPLVPYDFDDDDLLVVAGAQTIGRHAVTGAVASTTLGSVTSAVGYSSFAELASLAYAHGATPLFAASYSRDALWSCGVEDRDRGRAHGGGGLRLR